MMKLSKNMIPGPSKADRLMAAIKAKSTPHQLYCGEQMNKSTGGTKRGYWRYRGFVCLYHGWIQCYGSD
jgi:hypothetical protein